MRLPFGPGALVAAAFIGPGTVTTCLIAGSQFGYALVWGLIFATGATVILQDMAARLGAGAKLGLGEALLQATPPYAKWVVIGLVCAALAIGNSAYEAGNLSGAILGAEALFDQSPGRSFLLLILSGVTILLLLFGQYALFEGILVTLVLIMTLAFAATAIFVGIDWGALSKGATPSIPDGGSLTAIALIGTTIVPYNLFLHAATVREKWRTENALSQARWDAGLSIGLGGLISILIMSTAASSLFGQGLTIQNAGDMAGALEPVFGAQARYLIGIGLLAAGLTSAITAPIATAYAMTEIFPMAEARKAILFKIVAVGVVVIGTLIGLMGIRPVYLILIAQYANGLLLPIIAAFLLYVMNQRSMLGAHANGLVANVLGGGVVLVTLGLGVRAIARALGMM